MNWLKALGFAFCVVIMLLMAGCVEEYSETPEASSMPSSMPAPTSTPTSSPTLTPIKIDSFDLALEFDDNPIAAEAKYKGHLIEVSGMVLDIKKIMGTPYVKLEGIDEYGLSCVMCEFSASTEAQLIPLKKYDWATIRGSYSGYTMNRVSLEKCELVSIEKG